MSQRKTGVFSLGGRLTKSVATSAFALSALTGGVMLSGGEAKASAICFTFFPITQNPPVPCVDGEWTNTYDSFTYSETSETGAIRLEGINGSPDQANVRINFDNATPAGSSGEYKYKITYSGDQPPITKIGMDVDEGTVVGHVYAVSKSVYTDSTYSNLVGDLFVDENTVDDVLDVSSLNLNEYWIKDTWSITTTGIIQIVNTYQTPGPLPILGAGAAFGFSRKLRSRIKGVHAA
jgi:hypothetical protein